MVTIEDVTPRAYGWFGQESNMPPVPGRFTTGRMLAVDSSDDGQFVVAGSFASTVWFSEDGGKAWEQQFDGVGPMGGYCVPSVAVGPSSARWSLERNPRFLADITGDGRADIVGFGDTGVWTALSNGDGTFGPPRIVLADFGAEAGGWQVDRHPRFLADVTGDGRADIVGFANIGAYVALSNGDGTFQPAQFVIADFGYDQGWRVDRHPRFLADVTGDGRADVVGFGDAGVYVALNNGDGTFAFTPVPVIGGFGYDQGWRVDKHPRFLADVTGDGRADVVGFGDAGVYVALSNGDGTFAFTPVPVIGGFDGWRADGFPLFLADVTGDGGADIVGFGFDGVYVSLNSFSFPGAVPFDSPDLVLANFGSEATVLAIVRCDRGLHDAGIWRSGDGGGTWTLVHSFPRNPSAAALPGAGQLVWAPGTANYVYAAGGTSLAVSADGGATFADVIPVSSGGFQGVTHVAVAATPDGSLTPPVVYALSNAQIFASFDAGVTWIKDGGAIPSHIGGAVGLANAQSDRVMVVSPRSPLEVFVTGNANLVPPELWRGDYLQFLGTHTSLWTPMPLPNLGQQFSGNVFVAATLPGHGNALFYGPQRSQVFVAPLDPESAGDWHPLDSSNTHVDLHGIFLSPDFRATFQNGSYQSSAGTVWMTSDGGIFRSTDGGQHFHPAGSISTLSVVNIAGVALEGQGPVISLGTGDNDGFTSRDGGNSWQTQDYGGGDDDCSWSDPLRPHSMLVFTPRWDEHGVFVGGGLGQTMALYEAAAGELPDLSNTSDRTMIIGPPLRPGSTLWNASSGFGIRGSRPIIRNLPGDDPALPGDYVVIRFFGNFSTPDGSIVLPNNLAVLLRARQIRDIKERTDWDTPGGWRVDKHPRMLADLTGNGHADIVGFGDAGGWTALSTSGGSFASPHFVLADFGAEAGGWQVDRHPRFLADVTGDGRADIVGFANAGVYVALSNGDGTFQPAQFVIADFGYDQGWRVDKHPRFLADVTGDGRADVVGFGDAGVYVALSNGGGSFQQRALFVIPNFGYRDSGPVEQVGPFLPDPNVGIVQASGGHTGTVYYVGGDNSRRLWRWTEGMAAWQQLVPGGGASRAWRFFVDPYAPSVVYLLDDQHVRRSDDGGATWQVDSSLEQHLTSGGSIPVGRNEDADGLGDHYDVVLSDMQFDPFQPQRRFAVGLGGVFMTTDGVTWSWLLDTWPRRGRPANCYFDWITQPSNPALYVSFAGRGIVKIAGFGSAEAARPSSERHAVAAPNRGTPPTPEEPQPRVRTSDGNTGTTQAMPDNRVLITFDDGRSFVVETDQLKPQNDGTYLI